MSYVKTNDHTNRNLKYLWDFSGFETLHIADNFLTLLYKNENKLEFVLEHKSDFVIEYGNVIFIVNEKELIQIKVSGAKDIEAEFLLDQEKDVFVFEEKIVSLFTLNSKVYILFEESNVGNKPYVFYKLNSYTYNTLSSKLDFAKSKILKIHNDSLTEITFYSNLTLLGIPLISYSIRNENCGFIDLTKLEETGSAIKQIANSAKFEFSSPFVINRSGKMLKFGFLDNHSNIFYSGEWSTKSKTVKLDKIASLNKLFYKEQIQYVTYVQHESLNFNGVFKNYKKECLKFLLVKTQSNLYFIAYDQLISQNVKTKQIAIEHFPSFIKNDFCCFWDFSENYRLILFEGRSFIRKRINNLKFPEDKIFDFKDFIS